MSTQPYTWKEPTRFRRVSVPQASKAIELLDLFLSDIQGDPSAVRFHDLRCLREAAELVSAVKAANKPLTVA